MILVFRSFFQIYAMTLRLAQLFEAQLSRLKDVRITETRRPNAVSSSRTLRRTNNSNQYLGESGNENDLDVLDDSNRASPRMVRRSTVAASTPQVRTSRRRKQVQSSDIRSSGQYWS